MKTEADKCREIERPMITHLVDLTIYSIPERIRVAHLLIKRLQVAITLLENVEKSKLTEH